MRSWFVYILRCEDGSLYTGITTDVERRFQEHKNGEGGAYTNSFGAEEIVYTEQVAGKSAALSREHAIKGLTRNKKEQLIDENKQ